MKNLRLMAFTLTAIFIVTSCSKEEAEFTEANDQFSALKKAPVDIPIYLDDDDFDWPGDNVCAGPEVYDLYGGQTILMGTVSILTTSEDNLLVKYELSQEKKDAGCLITETHLYVGPLEDLLDKKGSPKIGHFKYAWEGEAGSCVVIMQIPDDVICEDGDVIAAHAVVSCGEDEETAWAKGREQVFALKSKMQVSEGYYKWAMTTGPVHTAITTSNDWCLNFDYLPLMEIIDGLPIPLVYYADGKTKYGEVSVELDGDIVRFTVSSDYGGVNNSHLFVGSLEYLNSIGICDHESFPFQKNDPEGQHVFEFPASILDGSFTGSRWGWFINYCPECD